MRRSGGTDIVRRSATYAMRLLREQLPIWVRYHTPAHTRDVVRGCRKISRHLGLNSHDLEAVVLAAWFHDTGYTVQAEGHEEVSARIAEEFLKKNGYHERGIKNVARCILATRIGHKPRSLPEKIVSDADLSSLGRRTFFRQNELLRQELEARRGQRIGEKSWLRRSHVFLRHHMFHSPWGREVLEPVRRRNLARIGRLISEM